MKDLFDTIWNMPGDDLLGLIIKGVLAIVVVYAIFAGIGMFWFNRKRKSIMDDSHSRTSRW